MLEQLEHLAKLRGCTHLVLEVAENNQNALAFYKKRAFQKLDAAIFMAKRVNVEPELLPPRKLAAAPRSTRDVGAAAAKGKGSAKAKGASKAKAPAKPGATSEAKATPKTVAKPKRAAPKRPAAGEG
jgi:hypothetical protein